MYKTCTVHSILYTLYLTLFLCISYWASLYKQLLCMLHILRFEYQPMRSGIHNIIHTTLHTLYIRILCVYTPVLSHNALCVVHYTDYAMDTTALTLLYIQYNTIRTRVCIIAIFLLYSELLYILCADEYTLHSILLILYFTYNTLYTVHCAYSARLITM